jgi:dipeptidyl aminopeptidase/acylaminoacyl peptidase
MSDKQLAHFGEWPSPVTSDLISSAAVGLVDLAYDHGEWYWTEMRPNEGGRSVIVRLGDDGKPQDVTPPGFNARTRIHEYGGAAFSVRAGTVLFTNFKDQRIYRQKRGEAPVAVTLEGKLRYADYAWDNTGETVVAVCEDHSGEGEPANYLVRVRLSDGSVTPLSRGNDFYAAPRLSPDGRRLAWLTWNHPNMPWDQSELWVADVCADGSLGAATKVAGQPGEAITEPRWSPDGVLYFVSDRTQWWNLYRWSAGRTEAVCEKMAEFTGPLWNLGMSNYGFIDERQIICAYAIRGMWNLGRLDVRSGELVRIDLPFTEFRSVQVTRGRVGFICGSPTEPWSIVEWDANKEKFATLKRAVTLTLDKRYLSTPKPIEFPTDGNTMAHGFFYAPTNPECEAPAGEKCPLVVISHGGPTAATSTALNLAIQFWTTRGIGVLDVNYGGSTGYGTAYRRRLNGQWGVVDVTDCIRGARYLVDRGEVDGNRLAIRGGSAGGYTTLCAITFHTTFKAGVSYYGVADIEMLLKDTHKFESRYDRSLVGPYPESRDKFVERSPIHFVDKIACPLLLLQGLDDKVVPPNQAEIMYQAVKKKGVPVALVTFAGEDHGFRKRENIKAALDAELYFYSRVFDFEAGVPSIPIDNL